MNRLPLAVCAASLALYLAVLFFYSVRIRRQKRLLPEGSVVPKATRSFKAIFVAALLLVLLPLLIPLGTPVMAVVCACGILGEYLALKDRLEQLRKLCG